MRILIRIIDKILNLKKIIIFKKKFAAKNALISYVLVPKSISNESKYYKQSHNNKLMCKIMIDSLLDKGFNVYLYNYLNENINIDIKYDIFIGHNISFHRISQKINQDSVKILLTTGSSPTFDNAQLKKRYEALCERKNTQIELYKPIDNPQYPFENFKAADFIYMIAADSFVSQTWYQEFQHKFINYHNLTQFIPVQKNDKIIKNNFIFMSSTGQLRRGLDIVLDAFLKKTQNKSSLYVCGPYEQETNFCKVYANELYSSSDIHPMGMLDTSSSKFFTLIDKCDFIIVPSCSEGQSGSVLNLMALGLIPIITKECGFTDVEEYGYLIPEGTVESVHTTLERALSASIEERETKRTNLYIKSLNHTPSIFKENFSEFINDKCAAND